MEVSVFAQDSAAVIAVTDQGVGIPRAKQRRLIQRFYRAHTGTPYDYGGLGVGLYIARETVKRHWGTMWLTSQENKGSTSYVSLPRGGHHGGG